MSSRSLPPYVSIARSPAPRSRIPWRPADMTHPKARSFPMTLSTDLRSEGSAVRLQCARRPLRSRLLDRIEHAPLSAEAADDIDQPLVGDRLDDVLVNLELADLRQVRRLSGRGHDGD